MKFSDFSLLLLGSLPSLALLAISFVLVSLVNFLKLTFLLVLTVQCPLNFLCNVTILTLSYISYFKDGTDFYDQRSDIMAELKVFLKDFIRIVASDVSLLTSVNIVVGYTASRTALLLSIWFSFCAVAIKWLNSKSFSKSAFSCLVDGYGFSPVFFILSYLGVVDIGCHPVSKCAFTADKAILLNSRTGSSLRSIGCLKDQFDFKSNLFERGPVKLFPRIVIRSQITRAGATKRLVKTRMVLKIFELEVFDYHMEVLELPEDYGNLDNLRGCLYLLETHNGFVTDRLRERHEHSLNLSEIIYESRVNDYYNLYDPIGHAFVVAGLDNWNNLVPNFEVFNEHNRMFFGEYKTDYLISALRSPKLFLVQNKSAKFKLYKSDICEMGKRMGFYIPFRPYRERFSDKVDIVMEKFKDVFLTKKISPFQKIIGCCKGECGGVKENDKFNFKIKSLSLVPNVIKECEEEVTQEEVEGVLNSQIESKTGSLKVILERINFKVSTAERKIKNLGKSEGKNLLPPQLTINLIIAELKDLKEKIERGMDFKDHLSLEKFIDSANDETYVEVDRSPKRAPGIAFKGLIEKQIKIDKCLSKVDEKMKNRFNKNRNRLWGSDVDSNDSSFVKANKRRCKELKENEELRGHKKLVLKRRFCVLTFIAEFKDLVKNELETKGYYTKNTPMGVSGEFKIVPKTMGMTRSMIKNSCHEKQKVKKSKKEIIRSKMYKETTKSWSRRACQFDGKSITIRKNLNDLREVNKFIESVNEKLGLGIELINPKPKEEIESIIRKNIALNRARERVDNAIHEMEKLIDGAKKPF